MTVIDGPSHKWQFTADGLVGCSVNGRLLTKCWGIETADSFGFYSRENGIGHGVQEADLTEVHSPIESRRSSVLSFPEGKLKLTTHEKAEGSECVRTAVAEYLNDSYVMDFVMRFRFAKSAYVRAEIAGQTIQHTGSNVYYQRSADRVLLSGDAGIVEVCAEPFLLDRNMRAEMYVRDYLDEWVVHARMVPRIHHKTVVKVCNSWANSKPLPLFLSEILLRIPRVHRFLLYRNERNPYPAILRRTLNLNAYPMARLRMGAKLGWCCRVKFNP